MNISDAASRTGLPVKTIRYYEEIGLVAPGRSANGYRAFGETDLHKLAFVGRARALGFSVRECRDLLRLYDEASERKTDKKTKEIVNGRKSQKKSSKSRPEKSRSKKAGAKHLLLAHCSR